MLKQSITLGLLAGASVFALSATAQAGPASCDNRSNNNIKKLTECVTVEGVRAHQQALQEIANDSFPNNRASGFEGYDRSVDYVVEQLTSAGYTPVIQSFDFVVFNENTAATLEQTAPVAVTYEYLVDFFTMSYSGSGTVSGSVEAVDLDLGRDNSSTSGCEVEDFADFTAGNIALIQRGACSFQQKAENAEASGATGVIIFNQGNAQDGSRDVLFGGTLSEGYTGALPVVSATYDRGVEWSETAGLTLTLATDTTRAPFSTVNVLAETNTGSDDNIVMVGAHLDSVNPGPGIQDNGSGSAAILETAIQMSKVNLVNKVRFAWWGAEESGLIGSTFYINDLIDKFFEGDEQIFDIALYLNFDMIGSPNYVFKIYDGDDSDAEGAGPGPEGSAQIEAFFEAFYESRGEPYKGTDFSGRSDYGPFIDLVGIPAGGLFTGAEEIKTEEEAEIWGGVAGEQLDQCYHLVCDTFDNISLKALDINSDAVAASTLYYGMNTSEINGVEGKGNFTNGAALRQVGFMENMEMLGKRFQK